MHLSHFLDGTKLTEPKDSSLLISKERAHVKIGLPGGLLFVGGISNNYVLEYSEEVDISAVISDDELLHVIRQFNDSITSFWPCTAVYACGCVLAPLTLGFSLFAPNYCISQAEEAGRRSLEQAGLKSSYYHRDIKFELKKTWTCSSYIEINFPSKLLVPVEAGGIQSESDDKELIRRVSSSGNAITMAPSHLSNGSSPSRSPRGERRV